jgi:hypothetical protein
VVGGIGNDVALVSSCSQPSNSKDACSGSVADRICEDTLFITPDAAQCIAMNPWFDGVQAGLTVTLVYNYGYRRVVWNVMSDRFLVTVDAVTGRVLGQNQFTSTP